MIGGRTNLTQAESLILLLHLPYYFKVWGIQPSTIQVDTTHCHRYGGKNEKKKEGMKALQEVRDESLTVEITYFFLTIHAADSHYDIHRLIL